MEAAVELKTPRSTYIAPLLAGAVAGISVDVALYPLDTLKTRLQSAQGFYKAGGFKGVYKGLSAVATTSMPTTALFFLSYEKSKEFLQPLAAPNFVPVAHMASACIAEVLACVIRVPTEIAKQRKQTYVGTKQRSNISILVDAYKSEGVRRGVYRGFLSTVLRDLPFSFIELPVWEVLKDVVRKNNDGIVTPLQSACCGAVAGSFAAAATTPLDLAKTRIMLAEKSTDVTKRRVIPILVNIHSERGLKGLFAGAVPRGIAFFLGGFVFFGAYDEAKAFFERGLGR